MENETFTIVVGRTHIELLRDDITRQRVDAIVTAANPELAGGGGVDEAVHWAAGPQLLGACQALGGCPTGSAVITPGFLLPSRFVIHAVGPVWHGGGSREAELLAGAYRSALEIATETELESIAFPAISTGAYGYPVDDAARIALRTVHDYLVAHPETSLRKVLFVLYTSRTFEIFAGVAAAEFEGKD